MSEQTEMTPKVLTLLIYHRAFRLEQLVRLNAPAYVIERERRLLLSHVNAFPVAPKDVCDALDEDERMSAQSNDQNLHQVKGGD